MSSPPSNSTDRESAAFGLLDQRIQRWIWQKGWTELKDAQERAIPLLVVPASDVIIAAATASGKTEAAFLPILTRLATSHGLALYVSPLKALINDQWSRLTELCESLEIKVTPWHGDIGAARKTQFRKKPSGCLLITPESLEGLLLREGHSLAALLARLEYVVVDELHAFLDEERGRQLQSLLHRIESALARRVVRVGLSATLGEMRLAAEFLRPTEGTEVEIVESRDAHQGLKVIVKGIREATEESASREAPPLGLWAAAEDLFKLRGHNNLIFPNSRRQVEVLADRLREACETAGVPNEFWPHHGSLSKELREETERALKSGERPATAVATTTLELGIDIGAVKSVAQVGPAPSVASLRQRLGRSGRRPGEAAILRCYAIEESLTAESPLSDQLREGLVEIAAQIRLLLRGWFEPPRARALHLSTLVQQLLSLIAQLGGLHAADAWQRLCASGVFPGLDKGEFGELLRELGARDILMQDSKGLLLLARTGERIAHHYSFLAAFVGDEEFRIVTAGKTLGSLPLSRPVVAGSFIIFAGRRWRVLSCIAAEKLIEVEPAKSGQVPRFDGAGGEAHDEVRREMRAVLTERTPLAFLDGTANQQLAEGRDTFARLDLAHVRVLELGDEIRVLPWRGDAVSDTVSVWLNRLGLSAANEGLSIAVFRATRARVIDALSDIAESPAPLAETLAASAQNLVIEKWDGLLPEALLRKAYACRRFDVAGAQSVCAEIVAAEP